MPSTSLYQYELPEELIAQEPLPGRADSRTLYLVRGSEAIAEGTFAELPARLAGDECLVVNDTRVIPARIRARRATGGQVEIFLLRPEQDGVWQAWLSPSRRVRPGEMLEHGERRVEVLERDGSFWRVRAGDLAAIEEFGEVPVPPYIERAPGDPRLASLDRERYQTIFARAPGAVAAPTAGLHFTPEVTGALAARGIPIIAVTLHVGPGTFRPIVCEDVADHRVEPELYELTAETRARLAAARSDGRRIIAVGSTCLRLLESLDRLAEGPDLRSATALTILPGHAFRHVDGLITNFHLPRSSLLLLVATFHGLEPTLAAYRYAIERRFRFYSYGDAMAILPRRDGDGR